jgi:hypothetical protein
MQTKIIPFSCTTQWIAHNGLQTESVVVVVVVLVVVVVVVMVASRCQKWVAEIPQNNSRTYVFFRVSHRYCSYSSLLSIISKHTVAIISKHFNTTPRFGGEPT